MAIYEYRCDQDGTFDVTRPLGTAPPSVPCQTCGTEARRVFSAPMLRSPHREILAAIDHSKKSAHEPEVVTSIPSAGDRKPGRMAKMTPKLARLPRP